MLPPPFLGNKVTAYGGYLNYTVRFTTVEGGAISKNNAPDVELISVSTTFDQVFLSFELGGSSLLVFLQDNDIRLLYFNPNDRLVVNEPQTVAVPLLEQHWQRHDGKPANREHLIMALADLKSILIKATYTTITKQASLSRVSLDVAEERNTGKVLYFCMIWLTPTLHFGICKYIYNFHIFQVNNEQLKLSTVNVPSDTEACPARIAISVTLEQKKVYILELANLVLATDTATSVTPKLAPAP